MRLHGILGPAKSRGVVASAILLLSVSTATLSAFGRQDKEEEKKEAPAHQSRASEPASSQSRPAPEARSAPAPSYTPPSRQERSPGYNPSERQTPAPSYTPPSRQERSPSYNPSERQTTAPSYNPQPSRPSPQYNPNGSGTAPYQPGAKAPAGSGGWRQTNQGAPSNAPSNGGVSVQPAPAGSTRSYPFAAGGSPRLPPGQTTRNSDGSAIHTAADGRVIHMDPSGRVTTVDAKGGGQIHYAPSGVPDRVVTRTGAVVVNRPGGVRQIVVQRPGNVQLVTNTSGQGYIQRPFTAHGREYYQRTYYVQGRPYVNVYRPYYYHGAYFQVYTPVRYYRPAFYGWAWSPWGSPVVYSWGWAGTPWYGYYGPYFAPYPVYRSPLFWLTDFLFAATLQYGYDQRMADSYSAGVRDGSYNAQQAMSPDIKQMVADEVQRQLAQERAEGQNPGSVMQDAPRDTLPGIFNDGASHAFVVHNPINANDGGPGCPLTEGDVIGFEGNLTPGVEFANVRVLASKGQGCAAGSTVAVSLQDILEMQNNLRETIDRGLGQLQSNAGRNGLPALPPQAMGAPINSPLASQVPQADPNGAAELRQQAQEATQGAQAVLNESPALETSPAGDGQTPTVKLGMTPGEVQSLLGPPRTMVDLGQKKMFLYDSMKVVFMDGRVSDVE